MSGQFYPPPPTFIGGNQPFAPSNKLTPASAPATFPPLIQQSIRLYNSVLSSNWNEDAAIVDLLLYDTQSAPPGALGKIDKGEILDNWVPLAPAPPPANIKSTPPSAAAVHLVYARYLLDLNNAITDSWIPPYPQPILAYNTTPPTPTFLQFPKSQVELITWQILAPLPQLGLHGSAFPISGAQDLISAHIPLEVLVQWIPPPPMPQPSVTINSPWNTAVKPPAIIGAKITTEELVSWIPPPPMPQPAVTPPGIPVSQAPILPGAYIPYGLLNTWIPPDPMFQVTYLGAPPSGVQGLLGAYITLDLLQNWSKAWTPAAQAPVARNLTPPQGPGGLKFGRLFADVQEVYQDAWIPPQNPWFQVTKTLAPPTGLIFQLGKSSVNTNLFAAIDWIPPAPQPILPIIPVPPAGQNPPFTGAFIPFGTLNAWIPPDPLFQTAINTIPPTGAVDLPGAIVPGAVPVWWIPPPPQPLPTYGAAANFQLTPPTGFVPTPIGVQVPEPALVWWIPPPPMPQPSSTIFTIPPPAPPLLPGVKLETDVLVSWIPPPPMPQPSVAINLIPPSGPGGLKFGRLFADVQEIYQDAWIPPQNPWSLTAINTTPPSAPVTQITPGVKIGQDLLQWWIPPPPSQVFLPFVPPLFYSFRGAVLPQEVQNNWIWIPTPQPPEQAIIGIMPSYVPGIPPDLYSAVIPQAVLNEWLTFDPIPQPPIVGRVIPIYRPDNPQFRGTAVPIEVQNAWLTFDLPQPYYQYGAQIFFQFNEVFTGLTTYGFVYNTINTTVTISLG